MPQHPPWPAIRVALAQPALRAPCAFAGLAAAVAAIDLLGPVLGLAGGLLLLHAATAQPLSPPAGALAAGALASLAWLVF